MREPWTQLFVHLVWSTWDRAPFLTAQIQPLVYDCLQGECSRLGADVIAIGGIEDHVHLLARIPTTVSIAGLVKQLKGSSSHLVSHRLGETFKWQGGYGAFTVSKSNVPRVRSYVLRQEEHHRHGTLYLEVEPREARAKPSSTV
ncbi:MAG TPA: IS200/IS605 family transposase [Longimicrobiaceae bacterium]|nr:IS200/IS605 family transposase [Longimicrobiaceae bacterium]